MLRRVLASWTSDEILHHIYHSFFFLPQASMTLSLRHDERFSNRKYYECHISTNMDANFALMLCVRWIRNECISFDKLSTNYSCCSFLWFLRAHPETRKRKIIQISKWSNCKFLIWFFFFFELWLFVCPLIPDVDKSNNKRCMRHWIISWNLRCWFSFFAHSLWYSVKPMRLATASQLHFGDACAFSVLRQF